MRNQAVDDQTKKRRDDQRRKNSNPDYAGPERRQHDRREFEADRQLP